MIVGYVANDYWILRNSWGRNWGQDGYAYITQDQLRDCGVSLLAYSLFGAKLFASFVLLIAAVVL